MIADLQEENATLKRPRPSLQNTRSSLQIYCSGTASAFGWKRCAKCLRSPKRILCLAQKRRKSRAKQNKELLKEIHNVYKLSRGIYGSPMVTKALKNQGITCSRNRVARLMHDYGIFAKTKRRYKATFKAQLFGRPEPTESKLFH